MAALCRFLDDLARRDERGPEAPLVNRWCCWLVADYQLVLAAVVAEAPEQAVEAPVPKNVPPLVDDASSRT